MIKAVEVSSLTSPPDSIARPSRWQLWKRAVWIVLGALVLPQLFTALVVMAIAAQTQTLPQPQFLSLLNAAGSVAAFWLILRFIERRSIAQSDVLAGAPARGLGAGLGLGAGIVIVSVAVPWALGAYLPASPVEGSWLLMAGVLVAASVTEELLFRGLIFRALEEAQGSWAAMGISSLFFGLVHLTNPNASWLAAVAIAIEAGLLLSAAYLVTRSLWLPIGIHLGWNLTLGSVLGLPVSGVHVPSLLGARAPVDAWAGGSFGPELGLPTLVVSTAAGLGLLLWARRRGQLRPAPSVVPASAAVINR